MALNRARRKYSQKENRNGEATLVRSIKGSKFFAVKSDAFRRPRFRSKRKLEVRPRISTVRTDARLLSVWDCRHIYSMIL
jgi:hypothetical protein